MSMWKIDSDKNVSGNATWFNASDPKSTQHPTPHISPAAHHPGCAKRGDDGQAWKMKQKTAFVVPIRWGCLSSWQERHLATTMQCPVNDWLEKTYCPGDSHRCACHPEQKPFGVDQAKHTLRKRFPKRIGWTDGRKKERKKEKITRIL